MVTQSYYNLKAVLPTLKSDKVLKCFLLISADRENDYKIYAILKVRRIRTRQANDLSTINAYSWMDGWTDRQIFERDMKPYFTFFNLTRSSLEDCNKYEIDRN